jgi:UrcA family protein
MMRTAIFAAAAACLFEAPAAAAPVRESITVEEVNYTSIDLASKAGRAALERRIRAAAARVCAEYDLGSAATDPTVPRPCYRDAVESARRQMRQAIAQRTRAPIDVSARPIPRRD